MEKKVLSLGEFERFLGEELSLAVEFELPLTVVAIRRADGWDEGSMRRALDVLRLADLGALATPRHLVTFLPNAGVEGAVAVERRMREAVPETFFGFASHLPEDGASDMVSRACEDSESP